MMKIIKPDNEINFVSIQEVPNGSGFMINDGVFLKISKEKFVNLNRCDIRNVSESRTDKCARIVNLELKVTYA